jgi:hypothetical protein
MVIKSVNKMNVHYFMARHFSINSGSSVGILDFSTVLSCAIELLNVITR